MPRGAPLWSPQERGKSWYRWRRLQNEVIPSDNCVRWRTTWGRRGDVNKLRGELESLKTRQKRLEEEVGDLRSSLDGPRNDRARLEGDMLSLIEAVTLLEAELKDEGAKAVVAYNTSRGFESGLEKMGRDGSTMSSGTGWRSSGCGANIRK
ncbi:hypothetical protein GW17_00057150 [Ensete ventricosum]|nr:hypothetical protein GW17_00057150 [Ensete ventricosum]